MRRAGFAALGLALAGCCTTPGPRVEVRVVDTACQWAQPIQASTKDTPETKRQVLAHDILYQKRCPNGPAQ